ncbi:hypothetical protein NIES4073_43950 [Kalymmatonema gypsitolerans NIES-4073]|nr:hypothetical protein NIES4073_43950 [Scytonema sp. NIES-4073]
MLILHQQFRGKQFSSNSKTFLLEEKTKGRWQILASSFVLLPAFLLCNSKLIKILALLNSGYELYSGLQLGKLHKEIMNHRWTQINLYFIHMKRVINSWVCRDVPWHVSTRISYQTTKMYTKIIHDKISNAKIAMVAKDKEAKTE